MSSLRSLPKEVLEEIYLSIPKSMLHSEMAEALLVDEKKRLMLDGVTGVELKARLVDYKNRLGQLGPISLAEMAYETCVGNNTFDPELNQAWVDRDGQFRINPSDLYRHHFVESMFSAAEKVQGFGVTTAESKKLKSQIDAICEQGDGHVTLGYGDVTLSFSAEKRQVKHSVSVSHQSQVDAAALDRISSSFSLFIDRCKPEMARDHDANSSLRM
jgi:hypothetical protein